MAQVKFTPEPNVGDTKKYSLEFDREGLDLPRYPQTTAEEQMTLRKGQRGLFPVGLDTRTPGMTGRGGNRRSSRR
jgi:hypothetical protein